MTSGEVLKYRKGLFFIFADYESGHSGSSRFFLTAPHWQTLATHGRSLWEGAELSESRIYAALVKAIGLHEFALQGIWRSGLSGSLAVSGRAWALAPRAERGVWLTWTARLPRS